MCVLNLRSAWATRPYFQERGVGGGAGRRKSARCLHSLSWTDTSQHIPLGLAAIFHYDWKLAVEADCFSFKLYLSDVKVTVIRKAMNTGNLL